MQMRGAGIATVSDKAQRLTSVDPHTGTDAPRHPAQMRAVVTHAIVAHDRHIATTPRLAEICRRGPPIDPAHLVHPAADDRHEPAPPRSEDVGRRVVMVDAGI